MVPLIEAGGGFHFFPALLTRNMKGGATNNIIPGAVPGHYPDGAISLMRCLMASQYTSFGMQLRGQGGGKYGKRRAQKTHSERIQRKRAQIRGAKQAASALAKATAASAVEEDLEDGGAVTSDVEEGDDERASAVHAMDMTDDDHVDDEEEEEEEGDDDDDDSDSVALEDIAIAMKDLDSASSEGGDGDDEYGGLGDLI